MLALLCPLAARGALSDPPRCRAMQGAVAAIPANATGWVHRSALYSIQYGVEWNRVRRPHKGTLAALGRVPPLPP